MYHIHILKYEFIKSNSIESKIFCIWSENKDCINLIVWTSWSKTILKIPYRSISSGGGCLQILKTIVTLNLKTKILHMHEYLITDKKN